MFRKNILAAAVATVFVVPASAFAADDAEIKKIREEIETIKDEVCLTVTHDQFKAGSTMPGKVNGG